MSLSPVIAVRLAGLLAGLCLVATFAFGAWRVPPSQREAAIAAQARVVSTGEVGVEPGDAVVRGDALVPGGPAASDSLRLLNRTASRQIVAPRVSGGDPALDRVVEIELRVAGSVAFQGSLARLRDDAPPVVTLPRGGGADVRVALRVPESIGEEALARGGAWTLTFGAARGTSGR